VEDDVLVVMVVLRSNRRQGEPGGPDSIIHLS